MFILKSTGLKIKASSKVFSKGFRSCERVRKICNKKTVGGRPSKKCGGSTVLFKLENILDIKRKSGWKRRRKEMETIKGNEFLRVAERNYVKERKM